MTSSSPPPPPPPPPAPRRPSRTPDGPPAPVGSRDAPRRPLPAALTSRTAAVLATLAAATLLGLMEAGQVQYDRALQGAPITWEHALIHGLPRWYAWALMLPLVLKATAAIARSRHGPLPSLLLHLAVGAGVILLQVTLFAFSSNLLHGEVDALGHLRPAMVKYMWMTFVSGLLTYGAMVGGWYAVEFWRRSREGEREASRLAVRGAELERRLAESQLQRLQAQLEPHFLFNALHSLSALMLEGDTRRAVRTTTRLSDLLRRALRSSERTEHTVAEEVSLVEDYLGIQQVRFEDRLHVEVRVEPGCRDALVPALVLQPLVENALIHGIERDPDASVVRVEAGRVSGGGGEAVRLRVVNEGPPLGAPRPADTDPGRGGVGLENVRGRLETLYGDDARLELGNVERGVEAVVTLPYRTGAPEPAGSAR